MSCVYKGEIVDSEISREAKGGTEMMRDRLVDNVDPDLLSKFAIHFSRPRKLYDDVPNILYCHDSVDDPENDILKGIGWQAFDHFVFVSAWQRDQYVTKFNIPYSECSVIYNAVETEYSPEKKSTDTIRFIYHTTPHRGLELLIPIFDSLSKEFPNIHLDVYSSFGIYGWESRDLPYQSLFKTIEGHEQMTYHGVQTNDVVLSALKEAHIFLYPNIWQETSCIALIEAIKSQVICVHPNYGALAETGANATIMYDYNEDATIHANFAYSIARQLIHTMLADENYFNKFTFSDRFNLARNNIASYKTMWNSVLRNLTDDEDTTE